MKLTFFCKLINNSHYLYKKNGSWVKKDWDGASSSGIAEEAN